MPSAGNEWANLGRHRRRLAAQCYHRDRNTPDYHCPRCLNPIDWDLAWPHPDSRSADHIIELQDGGPIDDLDNLTTVHLRCNASKGATRRAQRARQMGHTIIAVDPTDI